MRAPLPAGPRRRARRGSARAPRARSAPRGSSRARARPAARARRRRRRPPPVCSATRAVTRSASSKSSSSRKPGSSAHDEAPVRATSPLTASPRSASASAASTRVGARARRARARASSTRPPSPNGSRRRVELGALELAGDGGGEHVAGEPALGVVGHAPAQQLERDDGDRLVQDEAVDLGEAAGVLGRDEPGLRAAPSSRRRRATPTGSASARAARSGSAGHEAAARRRARARSRSSSPSAATVSGSSSRRNACSASQLAAAVEDERRAADERGERGDDRVEAALAEDDPLQALLRGDRAPQQRVLLVDQPRERLLGDRDERRARTAPRRAGSRARCGGVDERLGHLLVREARCRSPSPASPWSASRATYSRWRLGACRAPCPVVSSSSPPDSHGVGSRELGDVHPADGRVERRSSPASRRTSRSAKTSRTVSIGAPASAAASVHPARGLLEHGPQDGLDLLELLGAGDQRRRELDDRVAAVVGAADQPAAEQLAAEVAAQQRLGLLAVEALLGVAVLDELDRVEVAGAAHVADDRDVAQRLEHRAQVAARSRARSRGCPRPRTTSMLASATARGHRVPAEREAVDERRRALEERLDDAVGGDHRAHRRVGGREALGRRDDVGLVVVALGAEPVAEAAPGADDLVGDQQHVVAGRRSRARAASSPRAA